MQRLARRFFLVVGRQRPETLRPLVALVIRTRSVPPSEVRSLNVVPLPATNVRFVRRSEDSTGGVRSFPPVPTGPGPPPPGVPVGRNATTAEGAVSTVTEWGRWLSRPSGVRSLLTSAVTRMRIVEPTSASRTT